MKRAQGERSTAFETGAGQLGLPVEDLPLSVLDCLGCGGCNVGCQFGRKTGGPHGHRPAGRPVQLSRAGPGGQLRASGRACRAVNLVADFLSRRAVALKCLDLTDGKREVQVKARQFVLAAGPIACSRILRDSLFQVLSPVGRHMAANVVSPVFAELPTDIEPAHDNPGVQMCVFVDQGGHLLESLVPLSGLPRGRSPAVAGRARRRDEGLQTARGLRRRRPDREQRGARAHRTISSFPCRTRRSRR